MNNKSFYFPAILIFFCLLFGCSPAQDTPTTAVKGNAARGARSVEKAGIDASQTGAPVDQCLAAYEKLVGPGGCLDGLIPPERIRTACQPYMTWAENADACGAQAYANFFNCLGKIDCQVFLKDKLGNDTREFPKAFTECRRQFATDMDPCLRPH